MLQSFNTMHIPRLVRGKRGAWDPTVCFDWGQRFIAFLKSTVRAAGGNAQATQSELSGDAHQSMASGRCANFVDNKPPVWRVVFRPNEGVSVTRLGDIGVREVEAGEDRVGFLPRWYFDKIWAGNGNDSSARPTQSSNASQNAGGSDGSEGFDMTKDDPSPSSPPHVPSVPLGWVT